MPAWLFLAPFPHAYTAQDIQLRDGAAHKEDGGFSINSLKQLSSPHTYP